MADILASHGAAAMGSRTSAISVSSLLTHLRAWLAAGRQSRELARLDARLRRDMGLHAPAAPQVAVQPGWDVRLLGLR